MGVGRAPTGEQWVHKRAGSVLGGGLLGHTVHQVRVQGCPCRVGTVREQVGVGGTQLPPMPLTDVIVSDGVAVHAERFVGGGELETKDTPEAAARSGRLLADLVRRLAALNLDPPLPNPEWVRWDAMPERHAAAAVPTWIEDATRRVQAKLAGCDLPPVLGHADWEAQNMRWRHGEPHAVHDWDGLAWLPEAAIAGSGAGIFASHGGTALAPLESSEAFLHAYESELGARFSPYETEIAWAASIWEALHNARD